MESSSREPLFETTISLNDIEQSLRTALNTASRFGAARTHEQIGKGTGFLSKVVKIQPHWSPADDSLPREIVVKLPTCTTMRAAYRSMEEYAGLPDEQFEEVMCKMEKVMHTSHESEVLFYELISRSGCTDLPLCNVLAGERFAKDKQGLLIMESVPHAHMQYLWSKTPAKKVEEILLAYAKIQAVISQQNLNPLYNRLSDLYENVGDVEKYRDSMCQLRSRRPSDDTEWQSLIEECVERMGHMYDMRAFDALPHKLGIPLTIVHGDFWISNVIWSKSGDDYKLAAILDWQQYHYGLPGEDMCRLLFSAMSTEERRREEKRLMAFYHAALTREMAAVGLPVPYTLDQLLISYRHCARVCACVLVVYIAGIAEFFIQETSPPPSSISSIHRVIDDKLRGLMQEMINEAQ